MARAKDSVNLKKRLAASASGDVDTEEVSTYLNEKEYLTRVIYPALFPALEQTKSIRPKDPIEFLAFYMMRHADGYNKTILTS